MLQFCRLSTLTEGFHINFLYFYKPHHEVSKLYVRLIEWSRVTKTSAISVAN